MPFSRPEAWTLLTPWENESSETGSVWVSRRVGPFQLEVVKQQGEGSFAAFILMNEREYRLPGMWQTLVEAQLYLTQFLTSRLHQLLVKLTSDELKPEK